VIARGLVPYQGKWAPARDLSRRVSRCIPRFSREVFEEVGLRIPNERYVPFGLISLPAINQADVSFLVRLERRVATRPSCPEVLEAKWSLEPCYPASEIWDPESGRDVNWLFEMARTGRVEFFQQTDLKRHAA
jgi:hypothetical protein